MENGTLVRNLKTKEKKIRGELFKNQNYLIENYDKFMKEYPGKNIAIYGCQIIDQDTDLDKLTTRVRKKYGKDFVFEGAIISFIPTEKVRYVLPFVNLG